MVAPAFEVKQKVLQLVVQRIVVEDHRITIEHIVPSGPIRLQPERHPPKKVHSRVRRLPQTGETPSASPPVFDEQTETGIFRDTHNRCGALGTVRFANPRPLEHLAFYPSIFIPLPEAFEGVHN